MKLRSLEAFCAAVEEQTISGAARRMYVSQPSVSDRLAELEKEARVPLLKRSPHGVKPTERGALLYEHGKKTLEEIHGLERFLHSLHNKYDMRLRVSASSTIGEHVLPRWLRQFSSRSMPDIVSELYVGNTWEVVEQVHSGKVGLGVIEGRHHHSELESVPLVDDELVVVVSPEHRWAKRRISAEDLPHEPFISREEGSGTRAIIEQALTEMGDVALDVHNEIGSTSGIKEAIEAGLGFSILSRAAIRLEVQTRSLAIAEGFTIPRRFTLIRSPGVSLSVAEEEFYDYLMQERERLGTGL